MAGPPSSLGGIDSREPVSVFSFRSRLVVCQSSPGCTSALSSRPRSPSSLSWLHGILFLRFWFPMPLAACECYSASCFCVLSVSDALVFHHHGVHFSSCLFVFLFLFPLPSFPCRAFTSHLPDRQPLTRLRDWLHGKHISLSITEIHDCSSSHLVTFHAAALSTPTLTCLVFCILLTCAGCFFAYHRLSSIVDHRRLVF